MYLGLRMVSVKEREREKEKRRQQERGQRSNVKKKKGVRESMVEEGTEEG